MNSYQIHKLLKEIDGVLYTDSEETKDNYSICWQYAERIQQTVLADIKLFQILMDT